VEDPPEHANEWCFHKLHFGFPTWDQVVEKDKAAARGMCALVDLA
jgi:hypothetical protein